ncbi:DUF5666 domain-containing protein [Granulicella arctica]|uniref:Co-chaperonin GroES (HSP10) n=1 Tax=Granulicella arctica TaxID=940613 RepID=A0A7Y9TG18_9BACT|nr:DUF5666 domain-containing protein [Granulicella arctica]NYF79406.1 co-chaperonin GroES (HSP10) [Granulicella arctica]
MRSIHMRSSLAVLLAAASMFPALEGTTGTAAWAQAAAAAPAGRQLGTVKAVSGGSLTIATDAGQQYTVTVADGARIVQLAPGSTDLKTAEVIALPDIGVGDRVLVVGKAGDTEGTFTASRVILMKSTAIAQLHESEQADWKKRGVGGIVSSVDAGAVTVSSGTKKIKLETTGKTIFRRYAGDSVKFENATPGTLGQIQPGDQLEVRGTKSDDGLSIQAEEVVSGSFKNLSGTLATINATAGTVTLKDLATKKMMTVTVTANSDLRKLPPQIAAQFAARAHGGAAGAGAGQASARPATTPSAAPDAGNGEHSGRAAGADLSKMLARLPNIPLTDLHTGDAVMIVASQSQPGSDAVTAVTLLSGVEPILAASPAGSEMTLSPWSVSGAPEGGGAQ